MTENRLEWLRQHIPKLILSLALLLLLVLLMSLLWPELRPELIRLEPVQSSEPQMSESTTDALVDHVQATEPSSTALYPAYITGAIVRPGVYYLEPGAIVADLVSLAGGLQADAATDYVNLAAPVRANEMHRIPYQDEVLEGSWPTSPQENTEGDTEAGLININTASESELETLPGIGAATAKAIVAWREASGPFLVIEDIMQVSGIKEARFNQIKALITV